MKNNYLSCNPDELAKRVKLIRKDYGLTQEDLATALGVGRPYINRIENGKTVLTVTLAKLICLLYKYNMEWLLGYWEDDNRFID